MTFRTLVPAAILAASAALFGTLPATAQQTAPIDTAAVLTTLARDLVARGDSATAEVILRLVRDRYPLTAAGDQAGRRLSEVAGAQRPDRSGAVELYVWSTLYGLWLGVAVPGAFGAEGPEPYGVGLLVGGPAGFFGARSILRERPLSVGQARAITWGGTWGTWQGFGWGDVLDLTVTKRRYDAEVCLDFDPVAFTCRRSEIVTYESEDYDSQKVFASLIAGGAVGIATGAILASRGEITPGTATLVNFGSLWGTWFGAALAIVADQDQHDDRVLLWSLVGGNVGLIGTALVAPGYDIGRTRARLINLAGVVGLLGGFGLDLVFQPDNQSVVFGIPLVTSAAGLAIGTAITSDYDQTGRPPESAGVDGIGLIRIRDARIDVGMPLPTLTLRPAEPGTRRAAPALSFTLLEARF